MRIPGLCIVGGSHARNLASVMQARQVKSVLVGLTLGDRLDACDVTVLHYGQWDLSRSGKGDHPHEATPFNDIAAGLWARYNETAGIARWVLPMSPIPLNCDVTTCPPTDWRSPPMIDAFNALVYRTAAQIGAPIIHTSRLVGPMWDSAGDYKHPHGVVLHAIGAKVVRISYAAHVANSAYHSETSTP